MLFVIIIIIIYTLFPPHKRPDCQNRFDKGPRALTRPIIRGGPLRGAIGYTLCPSDEEHPREAIQISTTVMRYRDNTRTHTHAYNRLQGH